ncbi:MAG: hypothetical protein ACR2RL_21050 [Gammaproteobacteria bacterium]
MQSAGRAELVTGSLSPVDALVYALVDAWPSWLDREAAGERGPTAARVPRFVERAFESESQSITGLSVSSQLLITHTRIQSAPGCCLGFL